MQPILRRLILTGFLSALLAASKAAPITYSWSGTTTWTTPGFEAFFPLGTPYEGHFTYDPDGPRNFRWVSSPAFCWQEWSSHDIFHDTRSVPSFGFLPPPPTSQVDAIVYDHGNNSN